jgi:YhcN/YlaJ family sporulation lipoprotein
MKIRFVITVLLIVTAGCGQAPENGAAPNSQQGGVNGSTQIQVKQTAPGEPQTIDAKEVELHLEQVARRIPQVKGAHCVIFGNTAIVGIDLDPNLERSRVGTIKYSVAEAMRKDPLGANAIVTADLDISHRLKGIRDSIINGKPISGFANELSSIVGRIMPQLPQNTLPRNHDTNDNQEQDSGKIAPQSGDSL